jgi:hypothetical protein
MPRDERTKAGGQVHALARHVHAADVIAKRRFGDRWKDAHYNGIVVSWRSETKTGQQRASVFITIKFDTGSDESPNEKICEINKRSVKSGWLSRNGCRLCPPTPEEEPEGMIVDSVTEGGGEAAPVAAAPPQDEQPAEPSADPPAGPPAGPPASSAPNPAPAPANPPPNVQPSSTTAVLGRLIHRAQPVHESHGRKWYDPADITGEEVKRVVERQWFLTDENGIQIGPAMDPPPYKLTHLKAFLLMMPPAQITEELRLMNLKLKKKGKQEATRGELLKFYGVNILVTRLRPHSRRDLWEGKRKCKYIEPNDLSRTGMTRHRYEEMLSAWEFSACPDEKPDGMTYQQWAWSKLDGFVTRFNEHRAAKYSPTESICMSPFLCGMDLVAIGSTKDCPISWPWIESRKMAVRYKLVVMARPE